MSTMPADLKVEKVVINASPLITLAKANLEMVLPKLFRKIVVPQEVCREVGSYRDVAWQNLLRADWFKGRKVSRSANVQLWNLGQGESEVLSWAVSNAGYTAIVDDLAARKCAKANNVPLLGTIGVLVLAHRTKLIPSLEQAFEKIQKAGLYLSADLITEVLEKESSSH
jgi:predicted nucleic acid-binding protein